MVIVTCAGKLYSEEAWKCVHASSPNDDMWTNQVVHIDDDSAVLIDAVREGAFPYLLLGFLTGGRAKPPLPCANDTARALHEIRKDLCHLQETGRSPSWRVGAISGLPLWLASLPRPKSKVIANACGVFFAAWSAPACRRLLPCTLLEFLGTVHRLVLGWGGRAMLNVYKGIAVYTSIASLGPDVEEVCECAEHLCRALTVDVIVQTPDLFRSFTRVLKSVQERLPTPPPPGLVAFVIHMLWLPAIQRAHLKDVQRCVQFVRAIGFDVNIEYQMN